MLNANFCIVSSVLFNEFMSIIIKYIIMYIAFYIKFLALNVECECEKGRIEQIQFVTKKCMKRQSKQTKIIISKKKK